RNAQGPETAVKRLTGIEPQTDAEKRRRARRVNSFFLLICVFLRPSAAKGSVAAARLALEADHGIAADQVQSLANALRVGVGRTVGEGTLIRVRTLRVAFRTHKHHEPILLFPLHGCTSARWLGADQVVTWTTGNTTN